MRTLILLFWVLCFTACEQGTLLNSEADILEVILPPEMNVGQPVITNNTVRIPSLAVTAVQKAQFIEQLQHLEPQFVLTEGAHILPVDTIRDFTQPQQYTVVSQDGKWTKTYTFSFFPANFEMRFFDFSNYEFIKTGSTQYIEFYELQNDVKFNIWASGNAGFALTTSAEVTPDKYPTFATINGKAGSAAQLVTCSTGALGVIAGMPFAAGNLFLGNFELANAMTKPLEATQFGIQTIQNKPVKIGIWCKYKAGATYKDRDGNILQKEDRPNIYAVFYEAKTNSEGKPVKLNGTNVQTDTSIICIAALNDMQADFIKVNNIETDDYKYIEIPFVDRTVLFNPQKQIEGKYYFTMVFSSSSNGDLFEGAIGSTLCIDEVEIL